MHASTSRVSGGGGGGTDAGSCVLIFREIEPQWRNEHPLNLLAAFMTHSRFSHVELAIGDYGGGQGEMRNVVRVFNDPVGCEVAERTGRSPSFQYVQLGCSRSSERAMLTFATRQKGKPFSFSAMARSIVWPRVTTGDSYFCAGAHHFHPSLPPITSTHPPRRTGCGYTSSRGASPLFY